MSDDKQESDPHISTSQETARNEDESSANQTETPEESIEKNTQSDNKDNEVVNTSRETHDNTKESDNSKNVIGVEGTESHIEDVTSTNVPGKEINVMKKITRKRKNEDDENTNEDDACLSVIEGEDGSREITESSDSKNIAEIADVNQARTENNDTELVSDTGTENKVSNDITEDNDSKSIALDDASKVIKEDDAKTAITDNDANTAITEDYDKGVTDDKGFTEDNDIKLEVVNKDGTEDDINKDITSDDSGKSISENNGGNSTTSCTVNDDDGSKAIIENDVDKSTTEDGISKRAINDEAEKEMTGKNESLIVCETNKENAGESIDCTEANDAGEKSNLKPVEIAEHISTDKETKKASENPDVEMADIPEHTTTDKETKKECENPDVEMVDIAEHASTDKETSDKSTERADNSGIEDKGNEMIGKQERDIDNAVNDIINKTSSRMDVESVDSSHINEANSIFVQVNAEKDDLDKSINLSEPGSSDVDPIGSSDWSQSTEPTFVSDLDEVDECIVPDASKEENISSSQSSKESDPIGSPLPTLPPTGEGCSMKLSDKYLVSIASGNDESECMICNQKALCKYNCSKDDVKTCICAEDCLGKLKEQHPENVIVRQLRVKNFSLQRDMQSTIGMDMIDTGAPIGDLPSNTINCVNCKSIITNMKSSLSWEAMEFCDSYCLTKHQKLIGAFCSNCKIEVKDNFLGKYCVRFGYSVRQFCSSNCLDEYKKISKVCSYCQDDISGSRSGFLTSIGDRGMSKDFCSAQCMQMYSQINKHNKGARPMAECGVCHKRKAINVEFEYKSKCHKFCSEPCFVAFKYVNDATPERCDMCRKFYMSYALPFMIRYDGMIRKFCMKTCQNIYITTNRRIVSCCWCKVKKYNFDMIQRYFDNTPLIVCSLTCLNFFNASVTATKSKRKRCDFCHKICKGQYHITLADDSMKNFCSYSCVQEYQNKYLLAPARFSEQPVAIPSAPTFHRVTRKSTLLRRQIIPDLPGPLPIITSVRSLAPAATNHPITTRTLRSKTSVPNVATITTLQPEAALPPPIRRIVLLKPPDLPLQRNMATLVKPITCDVEVEFKPEMVDKAVQTEDLKDGLILVPIPVPIYVPSPMQMFQLIHPRPVLFPLPIPIPMFIPVTKQTGNVVLKDVKKNQVRTPTDPYEADLLMMAELVAGEAEKKEPPANDSDGDSDGDRGAQGVTPFSPEPQDVNTAFGDDMLQMALKMATDFEEPAVDLEGALTASTITATAASSEQVDEVAPIPPPVERTTFRGRRRGRPPRHGGRGRGRGRPPTQREVVPPTAPEPQQSSEPLEKPDANMCLKYTFGVNAWKQWVTTKNAELEKSPRKSIPFKADLLQLTSDELNYSLCLFVKEVRKPNGAEYAPDTIYYLCLGIQQYLFENGRIDNIFCDSYYDSFTDCLDEVCRKFSTLYNDSQYIVTRVEEEHLWESKQLGAHSPHVLLTTLMFFNTKHFNLTNVDEHMQLSFSHIMKHWKRVPSQPGTPKNSSRNILLRFYPPQSAIEGNNRKKKVYEQQENEENPLRCPVKLYEFYLSKCPESVKTRNDVFYLLPERSCVPDSPVWYSTMALGKDPLEKMLHRVKMVKEINVALLAS